MSPLFPQSFQPLTVEMNQILEPVKNYYKVHVILSVSFTCKEDSLNESISVRTSFERIFLMITVPFSCL